MRSIFVLMGVFCLAVTGVRAEEVKISANGLTLNANLEIAEGKSLKDGVVLITHGTLAHGAMEITTSLQELLAERGYSSLAISLGLGLDNRHGMYDCKIPHTHKHGDALDEIGLWLSWLEGKGVGDVVLLGYSRGGAQTAWFAAERDRASFSKVVLVAPMTWDKEKAAAGYEKRYKTALSPLLAKAAALVKQGKGETVLKDVDFVYCPKTSVSAESFLSYYGDGKFKDTPEALALIKKPVLVAIGSEDNVVTALPEKIKSVKSDYLTVRVVDDAGHFFRDLYADDLVDAIDEFISE